LGAQKLFPKQKVSGTVSDRPIPFCALQNSHEVAAPMAVTLEIELFLGTHKNVPEICGIMITE
jgi:hypothetical protein